MRPLYLSGLMAGSIVLFGTTPNIAQQMCKPALTVTEARVSEARNLQRTWTALLTVDASHCSTKSGRFEIVFARLKESAPDMLFIERFTWAQGQTKVSLDIWWDEWVQDYRVGSIDPCRCRN
jgi:hypothetical protein